MSEQGGSGRSDDMGSAASLSSGEEDADDWDDELGDIDDLSDPESDLEDSRELRCVLHGLAFRHLHEVGPLSATATTSRSSRCHCGSCTGEAGVPGQLCPQAHHSRIGIHQGLAQLSSQCRVRSFSLARAEHGAEQSQPAALPPRGAGRHSGLGCPEGDSNLLIC